jgi:MtN3 and saliva related transmembrane protein
MSEMIHRAMHAARGCRRIQCASAHTPRAIGSSSIESGSRIEIVALRPLQHASQQSRYEGKLVQHRPRKFPKQQTRTQNVLAMLITLIGVLAAIGTTGSWIPQAIKTIRSHSANDFSWGYLILFSSGVALWAIYGVLRHDAAIMGANFITLAFLLPMFIVKVRERTHDVSK